jgi:hypothetical protein
MEKSAIVQFIGYGMFQMIVRFLCQFSLVMVVQIVSMLWFPLSWRWRCLNGSALVESMTDIITPKQDKSLTWG